VSVGHDGHLLGIDFGGTKMAVALARPDGTIVEQRRLPTNAADGAERALGRAMDVVEKLVSESGRSILSAGVATPGVGRDDGIDLAPNVPGWEDLRLARALTDRIGDLPVTVWNDLNAAALAEMRHGALRGADPGLVVGLGTGVAAAMTIGGTIVHGYRGAAGEIGYTPVGSGELTASEPSLELEAAGRALDELAAANGLPDGAAGLTGSGSPALSAELDRRIDAVARAMISMCLLVDPQRVVVFGGMTRSSRIVDRLAAQLTRRLPFPPEFTVSRFAQDAPLVGALTLAAERMT